jgi:DnaJ-domain-containing protein 1
MFRKCYGLEGLALDSPDYPKAWEKASENFKTSFNDWLAFMKVLPKREHMALEKKYEALKEKVATQDETIRYLRNLLSEKNVPYTAAVQNFTEMMEKQAQQFHDLMESAGKGFKKE